jgi:hypothetical protein
LVREECLPKADWKDGFVVSGGSKIKVSYTRYTERTEIVSVAWQIFSAPRKFKNQQLMEEINKLRKLTQ